MGLRTQNIALGPRPAQSYNMKSAIHPIKQFGHQLLPLTQTVEALFQTILPEEPSKYPALYETIYEGKADNDDEEFGIWTSRSVVINANTNNYKDLKDLCHGWCAIVLLEDFESGDASFPELRVKIDFFFFFSFFFFIIYHTFVVKVQEIAWSASYGENKSKNPKRTNKGNIRHQSLHLGSVPVPGPHTGTTLRKVK